MSHRALYLTPIYDPQVGGAAIHFEQISRGLLERGTIESYVIISSYSPEAPLYERTAVGRVFRVLFSPKSIHKRWSKLKVALNYLIATAFTVLALLVYRISIVHTHTKRYFSIPVRIAKWCNRAVVIDGRDLGAPSFRATGDFFVCASRNIEQQASPREETTLYIPIGIDPSELDVSCGDIHTPTHPYLLYVGDVAPRKGVPELLAAYAAVHEDRPLVLIGERIDSNIDLDGCANMAYLGTRSHEEVLCYIQDADLVVLPSKEEALGRVILEALYHGTPVVCPPGVPEFQRHIPDTVISAVDPVEIKRAIESALREPEAASEYPLDRHFTANVVSEYEALYESLDESK